MTTWTTRAPVIAGGQLSANLIQDGEYIATVRLWGPEAAKRLDLMVAAPELLDMLGRMIKSQWPLPDPAAVALYQRLTETQ